LGWRDTRSLLLVVLLAFILIQKLHREERWLAEKYPGYKAYSRRTKRLLPWIY
jgi:protein-S-isoprenylcysteine O-methyltransferase Ste14